MENDDQNLGNPPTGGALSIYGQADAAMDDFPVLKAFQQYIDAEQSKSRKRMIMLCMFFGVLMTILVAVFALMIAQMNRDKQHVNDQLIEFLMKERERAPAAAAQPAVQQPAANPAQDAALKAMTETLSALKRQMDDQTKAAREEAAVQPTKAELELERKTEREAAKLRRAQELIAAEKRKIAEEKERLRQAEVERQRRRLYPEYYQKQEGAQPPSQVQSPSRPFPSPKPVAKKRDLTDADIADILREVDLLKAEEEAETTARKKAAEKKAKAKAKAKARAEAAKKKAQAKDEDEDEDDGEDDEKKDKKSKVDKPIEYFTDTEYALPVKVNGKDANWSLSLE